MRDATGPTRVPQSAQTSPSPAALASPLRQTPLIRARGLPRAPVGQLLAARGAHALYACRPAHRQIDGAPAAGGETAAEEVG